MGPAQRSCTLGPAHPLRFIGGLRDLSYCEERLFDPVPPPPPDGGGSKFGAFVPPVGVGGIGVVDTGLVLFEFDMVILLGLDRYRVAPPAPLAGTDDRDFMNCSTAAR